MDTAVTRRRLAGALGVLLVFGAALGSARADVIALESGDEIEGRVVRETTTEIIVEVAAGRVTVSRADVKSITRAPWRAPGAKAPETEARATTVEASAGAPGAGAAVNASVGGARGATSSSAAAAPSSAPATPPSGAASCPASIGGTASAPRLAADPAVARRFADLLSSRKADPRRAAAADFSDLGSAAVPLVAEAAQDEKLPAPVREALAAALGSAPPAPELLPAALRLAADGDPAVAEPAIWLIRGLDRRGAEAAPLLARTLDDTSCPPRVRAAALAAFAAVGGPALAPALRALGEGDAALRRRARQVLRDLAGGELSPELAALLDIPLRSADAGVRADALGAAAEVGDGPHRRQVAEAARGDADAPVRAAAVRALEASTDPADAATVVAALADPAPPVRAAACEALALRPSGANVGALVRTLYDTDAGVRRAAARGLERATGERLGEGAAPWRRWWEREGSAKFGG